MKTLHILAAAAIAVTVASCSGKPELSYMPAKAEGDSNWGLVDANGEFLFTDEFSDRPSPVVNGYFFVEVVTDTPYIRLKKIRSRSATFPASKDADFITTD